jgi:hypothetical protein
MMASTTEGKSKNAIHVTRQTLHCAITTIVVLLILATCSLQVIIIQQHRQSYREKMALHTDFQQRQRNSIIHYEGDVVDEEGPSRHEGHADDHQHDEEDPHLHPDKTGEAVLNYQLPLGFQNVLERAKRMKQHCDGLTMESVDSTKDLLERANVTADLTPFGIIPALEMYRPHTAHEAEQWNCTLPPETECEETQFTAIFMGYNPDRLVQCKIQVHRMTTMNEKTWNNLVKEVILVWNGDRALKETKAGRTLLKWAKDPDLAFRILYPLQEGFPNDLMNRYHPRFNITTKAILFYDDDGPFYSVQAVTSGFELWKRNANAQMGAMARRLDVGDRALVEKEAIPLGDTRQWVSNCRTAGDMVRYNFQHFAQTGANMALPSGSFLHSNYLCFLWHPVLEEIRTFVRAHPVHPDDVTVSTIVSHISGRAPLVYSRRVNKPDTPTTNSTEMLQKEEEEDVEEEEADVQRRRLLWDDGNHGVWARKRESSVNSLLGYFGSLNSGSDGWCFGTPYHDKERNICIPDQAREGMIPWMTETMEAMECPTVRVITE